MTASGPRSSAEAVNALELRNLSKSFGGHKAVDRLSLDIPRGCLFGFIGPNGSGKTTTLRMAMNILIPDSGSVRVMGREGSSAVRDLVGYLPEERGLYARMSVRGVLEYFGKLKGCRGPALKSSLERWLERMDLAAWADKKVEALSKGMAQRVQFIAAAISDPPVLILDEPFSGLDPVHSQDMKAAVIELKKKGTTILYSTHDMASAEKLSDRVAMIFEGKKVLDGGRRRGLEKLFMRIARKGGRRGAV